jgi:hypothetical protein
MGHNKVNEKPKLSIYDTDNLKVINIKKALNALDKEIESYEAKTLKNIYSLKYWEQNQKRTVFYFSV